MLVGFEKNLGTVVRLDWGNGQTKSDVPTDILFQWHTSLPQTRHSAGFGTYQESVAAGTV